MAPIALVLAMAFAVDGGSLSGTVVNAVTGAPLGKVQLRATRGDAIASTTSDSKGNFMLVDLPPGEYRLTGVRNGYLDTNYGARRPKGAGTPITLGAGEEIKDLQLKMAPYSVIAGSVRDSDGEPISGATIILLQQVYEYGRPKIQNYAFFENRTDDLGQYRIADLEPGKYYVRAITRQDRMDSDQQMKPVDHSAKSDEAPTVLLPTLYPGVTDPALARMVEVGAGAQVTGIDIPLVRSPVYHVTVIASAAAGANVGSAYLSSNPEATLLSLNFPGVKNKQGDFEFPAVPPGVYTMTAIGEMPGESGKHRFSARITALRVNRDYTTRITAQEAVTELAAHLSVDGKPEPPKPVGMAVVGDAEGRRAWNNRTDNDLTLSPDHYQIYLENLPPPLVVKSMRAGSTDVFLEGLTTGDEERAHIDLEIVLAPEGGTVDGAAAPGATVLLVAEPKLRTRFDSFHTVTADQQGHFHFDNVRPGEYKLFAWDDVEPDAWFDPEFLKKYENDAEPVTLAPNGHASAQLHLE